MSEYVRCETQFKDQEMLIQALMETGQWPREHIEVHEEAQHLHGYHGDVRAQKAHVIIRRDHVGRASNDIGFERQPDGSFVAHISEFDRHQHDSKWMADLKVNYGCRIIERQQKARGRTVTKTISPNGRTRLVIGGYR